MVFATSVEKSNNNNDKPASVTDISLSSEEEDMSNYKPEVSAVVCAKPKKEHNQSNQIDWSLLFFFRLLSINQKRKLGSLADMTEHLANRIGVFVSRTALNLVLKILGGRESTLNKCFPLKKSSFL